MINEQKLNNIIRNTLNRYLMESIQEGFSFDVLNSLENKEKVRYCTRYLGEPLGVGSSRVTFEIDDYQVLKLSHDYARNYNSGLIQNKEEYLINRKVNSPLLPRVLYHADDWSWIITEKVLPCTELDLYKVLGISETSCKSEDEADYDYEENNPDLLGYSEYGTYKNYKDNGDIVSLNELIYVLAQIRAGVDIFKILSENPEALTIITDHPWFEELDILSRKIGLVLGDIRLENLGIAMRNNEPCVVILDTGFTQNTRYKI